MNLLHRYILKSVLGACLVTIGFIAFVLLTGNAMKDMANLLADGQISIWTFLELSLVLLPFVLTYAIPMGILTGVLLVLGRLSAQQEITAMRAAGIGLLRITTPIFFLAFCGVVICLGVNLYYAPQAKAHYTHKLGNALRVNPMDFIVQRTFVREFPGYVIYVGQKDQNEMEDIWVWKLDNKRRVEKFIHAQRGHFDYRSHQNFIVLALQNARAEWRSSKNPEDFTQQPRVVSFDHGSVELSLSKLLKTRPSGKNINFMNIGDLVNYRSQYLKPVKGMSDQMREELLTRIQMSIQEKFCLAFSVLSLAIVAIPLGIKAQRKETSANLGIAVLLALGFFLLMNITTLMEKHPAWRPDLLFWLPNILFQFLGIFLWRRLNH